MQVGQEVKVRILKVEDGKISLSMKGLLEEEEEQQSEGSLSDFTPDGDAATSLADLLSGIQLK